MDICILRHNIIIITHLFIAKKIKIIHSTKRWQCANVKNSFTDCFILNHLNQNFATCSKCGYKDKNNQIALADCNLPVLDSYVCQKSSI